MAQQNRKPRRKYPLKEIPVYLFLGFLESGKTKFIQETMEDPKFDSGEKTLLLVCEEGEEEYEPEKFAFGGVTVEVLEDKSQLNPEYLQQLLEKSGATRAVVEYNGMWMVQEFMAAIPENWIVYQSILTADANTFRVYFDNMRQLFLDKFAQSELLIVNRADAVPNQEDREFIHKAVRQASRRCDIAYEYTDGSVEYDQIPDELPFDIEADVIEIGDEDFGIWYLDASEDPKKYAGKTVRFTAQVCQTPRVGQNQFVPGRFAMTCCVDDIQFVGFPCKYDEAKKLAQRSWIKITAKVRVQFHPLFNGEGPVLTALDVQAAQPLKKDVVTFS
jgi:uncharacterized repeat protein (TIGR03943 family)